MAYKGNLTSWGNFTSSLQRKLENMIGQKGEPGEQGPEGPPGPQGPPGRDADLTEVNKHLAKIATTEELGHFKPDGTTITVDPVTGIASAAVSNSNTKVYTGDLNNLIENGYYSIPANTPNAPTSSTSWLIEVVVSADATYAVQTARHGGSNNLRENVFQRVAVKDGSGQFIWGTIASGSSGYLGNWKIVSMNISDAIDSETPLTGASSKAVKQLNDLKANKQQENWINAVMNSAWKNAVSDLPTQYRKDEFGIVHLRGAVTGGSAGNSIFQLPVGYRPSSGTLSIPVLVVTGDAVAGYTFRGITNLKLGVGGWCDFSAGWTANEKYYFDGTFKVQ